MSLLWTLGMYASGSTWLFNTAREVAAAARPGVPVAGRYAETMKDLQRLAPDTLHVVKTHHLRDAEAAYLDAQATHILLSLRDPRDAVVSLMQHMHFGFAQALDWTEQSARFCARRADDDRTCLFVYERGFIDDPATLERLAALLDGRLDAEARARIFSAGRRAAIEAKIAKFDEISTVFKDRRSGDEVDLDTQWHRHHAGRSGESGRWRRLLPPQAVAAIEHRLQAFMRQFGYFDPA